MSARVRRGRAEGGFTLVELLMAVAILGIIGYALTQSVIVGLRSTRNTAARVSGAVAVENVASFFTADVQSAEAVLTTDEECVPEGTTVFLHLVWTVDGNPTSVSYALEPPGEEDQEVVRYACRPGDPTARRVLGIVNSDPLAGPAASVLCDGDETCPNSQPATVTLKIQGDVDAVPVELTVRRRSP